MPTVTVYTAERMKQIEDESIVGGFLTVDEDLVLVRRDGVEIQAGSLLGPTRNLLETMSDEYVNGGLVDVNGNLILSRAGGGIIDAGSVIGPQGIPGNPGVDGVGVIPGGAPGQWLGKASATDYDMEWVNAPKSELELIANLTVSTAGSVILDNIPQTFKDLVLVTDGDLTTNANNVQVRVNDVTAGYSHQHMYVAGGSVGGVSGNGSAWEMRGYSNSMVKWFIELTISKYAQSSTHQAIYRLTNETSVRLGLGSLYCSNTDPITKLTIVTGLAAGHVVALYGRGTA